MLTAGLNLIIFQISGTPLSRFSTVNLTAAESCLLIKSQISRRLTAQGSLPATPP